MKKNNAGITLVSLVITIIVLIILASISVYSGISTVRSAKLTKFTTELKIMQQKVNELYDSYMNNRTVNVNGIEYVGKGQAATETEEAKQGVQEIGKVPESIFNTNRLDEIFSEEGSGIIDRTGYRYYDIETIQALGLEDMEYEFFVNVETRSVVSIEGFNDYGKTYYTLDQVPNGVYNVEYNKIDGNLDFEATSEVKNDQKKIHVSDIRYDQYVNKWQVRYRLKAEEGEEENSWKVTQEFTGSEILIDVDELGIYEVQVFHGQEIVSEIKEVEVAPRPGLKIGDYVNYIYDIISEEYSISTIVSGYTSDYTVSQPDEKYKWRILNIQSDGTIDLIAATEHEFNESIARFRNGRGYNNSIYIINDICKTLYSNSKLGIEARNINIKDIEKLMNSTGIEARNAYIEENSKIQYGKIKTYIDNREYPALYINENGSGIDIETDGKTEQEIKMQLKKDGVDGSDSYYEEPTRDFSLKAKKSLTATQTAYTFNNIPANYFKDYNEDKGQSIIRNMLFEADQEYWVASRAVDCDANYASFDVFAVDGNNLISKDMFCSYGDKNYNHASHIRPIVTIRPEIKIIPVDNPDGSSEENMHQIEGI